MSGHSPMKRRRTQGSLPSRRVSAEHKFRDVSLTNLIIDTSWESGMTDPVANGTISAVPLGVGDSERIGRQVTMLSIHVHGFVEANPVLSGTTPPGDVVVRLAMVLDKQTNGEQMSADDCFRPIADELDINSFRELQATQRFSVLKDQTFRLERQAENTGVDGEFSSGKIKIPFSFNYNFRNVVVNYTGANGVVDDISDNSVHLMAVQDDLSTRLTYTARLRYTDK